MKKIVTRALAVAIAFTTMVSMSGIMTVNAEAATKSNVTVKYSGSKNKTAKVSSLAVTVDGKAVKSGKTAKVYLTGKSGDVKLDTKITVNVKNKKANKKTKAKFGQVTYSTSNKKVATVSKKGVITIKNKGKVTITVKSKANPKKTFKIKLNVQSGVKKMKLNSSKKLTLTVGDKSTFKPTVTTYGKVKKTIEASTSNKKVAKVSVKNGKVTITAVKAGTAEITVRPKFGSDKAQVIKVTVKKPAPAPVAKDYKTKVVFVDTKADTVVLKGTISWDKQDGIAAAVEEFAKALGGSYKVTIDGKTVEIKDGKVVDADLKKIPASGSKTDAEVKATITIADALKLVGSVDEKATAKFAGTFKMSGVVVSNVSLASKVVTFNLGSLELKAFVENGDLYLDGDQSALLTIYKEIFGANAKIIKGFEVVEK